MPCCRCCCGGEDCTEGQEGKCCCGGPSGTCCQAGEYCCGGVCQEEPCGCTGDCEWQVVWGIGDTFGWELLASCVDEDCLCAEPDVEDVGTEESPAQEENYFTPCQECLEDGDCGEGRYCCDGVCKDGPCCETAADCPTYGLPCEDFFPGAPEQCCDGACEPNACWPGAQITLSFTKKVGCTAGFLSGIAEGDPFDVVISGGSLAECGVTSVAVTSAPCLTAWTLGEECEVTDLTFSTASIATCEQCYEFVSWTSCRLDCNGDCV